MPRAIKYSLFGFFGLLALTVVVLVGWRISITSQLRQRIAAIRAAGEPVTLADIASPVLPTGSNAQTYLLEAEPDLKAIEAAVREAEVVSEPQPSEHSPPTPEVQAAKRSALAQHAKVISLLDKASQCPAYSSGLTEADFVELSALDGVELKRAAARALSYHAEISLKDGDPQTAIKDCVIMLRFGRLFDADPLLVNHLVAIAVRGMAIETAHRALRSGPISADLHRALDEELARHEMVKTYRQNLATERAYGLYLFDVMDASPLLWLWPMASDQCAYLDYMGLAIDYADRPFSDSGGTHQMNDVINKAGHFTQLVAPALGAASFANYRIAAQLRALRVLNALVQQPPDLEAAQALTQLGLPAEAMADPFNGQPLLVKKIPEGWIVYSVGGRLSDDGGTKLGDETDKNIGLSPLSPEALAADDLDAPDATMAADDSETPTDEAQPIPSANEAPPDRQF